MPAHTVQQLIFKDGLHIYLLVLAFAQLTNGFVTGSSLNLAFIYSPPQQTQGFMHRRSAFFNFPGAILPRVEVGKSCHNIAVPQLSQRRRQQATSTRLMCSSLPDQELITFLSSRDSSQGDVKRALEQGANANAADDWGRTALQLATKAGNHELAQMLLEAGANVHRASMDSDSTTPLHTAALYGSRDLVDALLKFGADVAREDDFGSTAWLVAKEAGHSHLLGPLQVFFFFVFHEAMCEFSRITIRHNHAHRNIRGSRHKNTHGTSHNIHTTRIKKKLNTPNATNSLHQRL